MKKGARLGGRPRSNFDEQYLFSQAVARYHGLGVVFVSVSWGSRPRLYATALFEGSGKDKFLSKLPLCHACKVKATEFISSFSTSEYTSSNILGRVTGHKQATDGTDYATGYTYNLAGQLTSEKYPMGKTAWPTIMMLQV